MNKAISAEVKALVFNHIAKQKGWKMVTPQQIAIQLSVKRNLASSDTSHERESAVKRQAKRLKVIDADHNIDFVKSSHCANEHNSAARGQKNINADCADRAAVEVVVTTDTTSTFVAGAKSINELAPRSRVDVVSSGDAVPSSFVPPSAQDTTQPVSEPQTSKSASRTQLRTFSDETKTDGDLPDEGDFRTSYFPSLVNNECFSDITFQGA
ncbi:unnamed protein product [Phytophthora lilii]|uniref:Unnamed protein product n=1 Tax=Phytophthora lilii TaxID=2077276 RepID=A0A9W6TM45_9STRA|nr:unnamed protein product [Phytophthora lilii]